MSWLKTTKLEMPPLSLSLFFVYRSKKLQQPHQSMTRANSKLTKKTPSSGRRKQSRLRKKKSVLYPTSSTNETPNTPSKNHDTPAAPLRSRRQNQTEEGVSPSAEYKSLNHLPLGVHARSPPQELGNTAAIIRLKLKIIHLF